MASRLGWPFFIFIIMEIIKLSKYDINPLQRGKYDGSSLDPLSAGIGAVGSIINGIFGHKSQKSANKTNLQIAQMNNEAALQQMRENNQWNWEKSVEMFNMENEYNSPEQQMARFRAAGLNPYVAMSEGLGSASSAPADGSTPTAESVPSFQQATVQPVPSVTGGVLDSLLKVAEIRSKEVQSAKTQREKDLLNDQFDDLVSTVKSEANKNKILALRERIYQRRYPQILTAEISKLIADSNKAKNDEQISAFQKDVQEFESLLAKKKSFRVDDILTAFVDEMNERVNLLREQQNTEKTVQTANRAAASSSNANAKLANAKAKTENDIREHQVEFARLQAESQKYTNYEQRKTLIPKIKSLIQQYKNSGIYSQHQIELIEQQVKLAEKENSWYHFNQVFDKLERLNDGVNRWMPWAISRGDNSNGYTQTYTAPWQ